MLVTSPRRLAYITQWQKENPEKVAARVKRWGYKQNLKGLCRQCNRLKTSDGQLCEWHLQQRKDERLQKLYGLSRKDFDAIAKSQLGRCSICSRSVPLHVDHCHDSGIIRGLLCNNCNNGLGRFKSNSEWLERAALYMRRYYPEQPAK